MKVTVVPAQVTTVEDRIIGSLTFSQMLLLVVPNISKCRNLRCLATIIGGSVYKFILMGVLAILCCILAIRIRGKILAVWFATILRYNLRPKHYVFDKNSESLRERYELNYEESGLEKNAQTVNKRVVLPSLGLLETAKVLATIENPASNLRFETSKRGGLHVRLTEIRGIRARAVIRLPSKASAIASSNSQAMSTA